MANVLISVLSLETSVRIRDSSTVSSQPLHHLARLWVMSTQGCWLDYRLWGARCFWNSQESPVQTSTRCPLDCWVYWVHNLPVEPGHFWVWAWKPLGSLTTVGAKDDFRVHSDGGSIGGGKDGWRRGKGAEVGNIYVFYMQIFKLATNPYTVTGEDPENKRDPGERAYLNKWVWLLKVRNFKSHERRGMESTDGNKEKKIQRSLRLWRKWRHLTHTDKRWVYQETADRWKTKWPWNTDSSPVWEEKRAERRSDPWQKGCAKGCWKAAETPCPAQLSCLLSWELVGRAHTGCHIRDFSKLPGWDLPFLIHLLQMRETTSIIKRIGKFCGSHTSLESDLCF